MEIRHSTTDDLAAMLSIYEIARRFMAQHGNPNQWGPTGWPPENVLRADIAAGESYVCCADGRIIGTFVFRFGEAPEPSYRIIEDGAWLNDGPYGVIHRLAADGTVKGVGRACIEWAFNRCGHLRIDTHPDNVVMQRLLESMGFTHCGSIHVEQDEYPRLAYEKS